MELNNKFIAIEGTIGVGKTTLARMLSKKLDAQLILEAADYNPFMHEFYSDIPRHAFQTQVYFLISRYKQLNALHQIDLFHPTTITDYMFDKDRIFASITLSEHEYDLYQHLYPIFENQVSRPDAVVYLKASAKALMSRIKRRNRNYESNLQYEYLEEIAVAYDAYFADYSASPLLVINTEEFNPAQDDNALSAVINELKRLEPGTTYFSA